ncbi:MAG: hypothetical protein KF791_15190 [Verrucomicrobiae bacterium]|nr:hypothetical protein [Verrucomicrobiae bacterium]
MLDGETLQTIADAVVPDAALRVRQQRLGPEILRTVRAIRAATNEARTVNQPLLFDHIALQVREPSVPAELLLVAPGRYRNPKEAAFGMQDAWPSDGHLTATAARSVFSTVERAHRLRGVTVEWLVTDFDDFANDSHRDGASRFWTLFLGTQDGRLGGFSPDHRIALARITEGRRIPLRTPAFDPADSEVVMHSRTRRITEMRTPSPRVSEIPTPPPGKTAIAILWDQGGTTNAAVDLDLYVQPPSGGPELYFAKPESQYGRLFRDVRQSLAASPESWRSTWEYVELSDDSLPTEVWINLYQGRGPIHGIVRVFRSGQEVELGFELPAVLGDHASDRSRRSNSPQWIRVPLSDVTAPAAVSAEPSIQPESLAASPTGR